LEFSELVKKRRSIHYFTEEHVTNEELTYILESAKWAPSAGNVQPTRYLIIRNVENRKKVWESTTRIKGVTPQNFILKAPVHIIVLSDTTAYRGRQSNIRSELFSIQDSAAATMNLLLAVADLEMGACWVGMFNEDFLREAFNIPSHIKPVAIIPIGHTKSKEKTRKRKPIEELVFYEKIKMN
jgi:nitroreductase